MISTLTRVFRITFLINIILCSDITHQLSRKKENKNIFCVEEFEELKDCIREASMLAVSQTKDSQRKRVDKAIIFIVQKKFKDEFLNNFVNTLLQMHRDTSPALELSKINTIENKKENSILYCSNNVDNRLKTCGFQIKRKFFSNYHCEGITVYKNETNCEWDYLEFSNHHYLNLYDRFKAKFTFECIKNTIILYYAVCTDIEISDRFINYLIQCHADITFQIAQKTLCIESLKNFLINEMNIKNTHSLQLILEYFEKNKDCVNLQNEIANSLQFANNAFLLYIQKLHVSGQSTSFDFKNFLLCLGMVNLKNFRFNFCSANFIIYIKNKFPEILLDEFSHEYIIKKRIASNIDVLIASLGLKYKDLVLWNFETLLTDDPLFFKKIIDSSIQDFRNIQAYIKNLESLFNNILDLIKQFKIKEFDNLMNRTNSESVCAGLCEFFCFREYPDIYSFFTVNNDKENHLKMCFCAEQDILEEFLGKLKLKRLGISVMNYSNYYNSLLDSKK
ncbi:hypothetical protein EDEG_03690 [Edhazardia aedis USNM 41457]|uniref:Uncharacterized protein n=1 Tax=Edhazardia aedis (strain USNM 41457) TaxID=1003232 RepID=J9DGU5_EDHAE|nr:hypothetical protein EDEG_03690 [Edhazardia aedis USNM 41457]|eukprot:EJW01830.1 hypothetical protein EDEG_03690 [Edhazardia aedis USNM 41457]